MEWTTQPPLEGGGGVSFYEFLGDKSPVTPGTRFLRKSRKSENGLS